MKFTEAKLEQAFIGLLENEGYPHFPGDTISRAENKVTSLRVSVNNE